MSRLRFRDLLLLFVSLLWLVGAKAAGPHFDRLDSGAQTAKSEIADHEADSSDESPDASGESGNDVLFVTATPMRPTLFVLGDHLPSEDTLFAHFPPTLDRPPRLALSRA